MDTSKAQTDFRLRFFVKKSLLLFFCKVLYWLQNDKKEG